MQGVLGRMAVICSLFATFSFATNIVDSRDNHNYKTLPSGKLNWFSGNLAYKNPEAQTNNGTVYMEERLSGRHSPPDDFRME